MENQAALEKENSAGVLYLAFELSRKKWKLGFSDGAVVNNVVSGGMSGLLLETSFKHRVELMKGFLNASVDLGPTAVFQ